MRRTGAYEMNRQMRLHRTHGVISINCIMLSSSRL
jgi:hypothetical protein